MTTYSRNSLTFSTELTQSKATLQADTGESITDFAYPYGLYNANVMKAAKLFIRLPEALKVV